MIHTLEFYCNISGKEKLEIEKRFNKGIKRVIRELEQRFPNFSLRVGRPFGNKSHNIYLNMDVIELLERENGVIIQSDYQEVQEKIEQFECQLFGRGNKKFVLNRIDYRLDVKVPSVEQRELLFKQWNKLAEKYGFMHKRTKQKEFQEQDGKNVYVKSKKFKSTIYIASKALCICLYDKEAERIAKKQPIKPYEKDILRFEVRLMTRHLAYKARSKKIKRSLEAYFNQEIYKLYINKYVLDIFGTGHFYKINKVREMLAASIFSSKEQEKLTIFLKAISRRGIEGVIGYRATKKNEKGYSRYLMQKHKTQLEEMGINIILLPVRTKVVDNVLINPLFFARQNISI